MSTLEPGDRVLPNLAVLVPSNAAWEDRRGHGGTVVSALPDGRLLVTWDGEDKSVCMKPSELVPEAEAAP